MPISITKQESEQEFELVTDVLFEGNSESAIKKVELWADDRWLLGQATPVSGQWAFSYSFNGAGTRITHSN